MSSLMHHGLQAAARRSPDRVALRAGTGSWTFGDLDALSNAVARHLIVLGVRSGDRVAVMCSNRPEFVLAVQGISRVGAAAVLLSPAWKAREVDHGFGLTSAVHALADGPSVALLAGFLPTVTDVGDLVSLLQGVDRGPLTTPEPEPDDECVLVFSSGTTGLPKAVRHTHRSIGASVTQWRDALGLGPDDRFQIATPPSHILGLLNLLVAADAGATVRLHARFDLDEVLRRIQEERMTLEMAVAPIALAMANHPHLEDFDLSSLRYIMWGATPVSASVAQRVTDRTGVRWLPAYGASELPVISANPMTAPESWRLDSAGLPVEGTHLRVVDLETGTVVGPGEVGEIQGKSAGMMVGYLPAEATAEVMADGWYRTGDVGWLEPDGWVHLTDRSKEMIKVNGFQVAPAELEAVLHGHPAVLDCAVFGVPDERAGEVPAAAVKLDPHIVLEPRELEQLIAASLASYKALRHVFVVDEIPRLPSGKVLRRILRETWAPTLVGA